LVPTTARHTDKRIFLASLGCAKNQVDSEQMLALLKRAGWQVTRDPAEAAVIVVNTCSFIESAADESIDTILELARLKEAGACRRLVVTGCLPERYRQSITEALPEVDVFVGTGGIDAIVEAVAGTLRTGCYLPDPNRAVATGSTAGRVLEEGPTAYLKISEGCDRHCTYCIIPRLRGQQQDRPVEALKAEAQMLIAAGKKELVLVAQETTAYGRRLPGGQGLDTLLAELAALDPGTWIRLMYGHPQSITQEVITAVARHDNVCSYFDIPVQHASDTVLRAMGRRYRGDDLRRLFADIRSRLPQVSLRTTLMTGFPGETDDDFHRLLDFVGEIRFDHLGVFMYSDSEDLISHSLPAHVPPEVAGERYEQLMALQQGISAESKRRYIGTEMEILVESALEEGLYQGRSACQAPEVDGMTLVKTAPGQGDIESGLFVPVRITEALDYDLMGVVV
jgi:ribosomal protein S12 methylthiotransferase